MDSSDVEFILGVIFGLAVGWLLIFSFWTSDARQIRKELGSAICEQEYGMEYESYYDGTLKCRAMTETDTYDGLKIVKVTGGSD